MALVQVTSALIKNVKGLLLREELGWWKIKSSTKTYENKSIQFKKKRIIIIIEVITPAAPREKMNELYQKINHYVYEIRMIELDEYLYGMNRRKIDMEKAYDIISDAHESVRIVHYILFLNKHHPIIWWMEPVLII